MIEMDNRAVYLRDYCVSILRLQMFKFVLGVFPLCYILIQNMLLENFRRVTQFQAHQAHPQR